jgi:DNA-binding XRE family transcriptional regulator
MWPGNVTNDELLIAVRRLSESGLDRLDAKNTANPAVALLADVLEQKQLPVSRTTALLFGAWVRRSSAYLEDSFLEAVDKNWPEELGENWMRAVLLYVAHVVSVAKRVELDRAKEAMAIDASREHNELLTGVRDIKKDRVKHTGARGIDRIRGKEGAPDRYEIVAPEGGMMQLSLPIAGECLSEAMAKAIREWRGWEGLRHYSAMLRLLSVEGSRTGKVRWTMVRHLDALGVSDDSRSDPAYLERVGREVELMTRLELAVYAPNGQLRMRQALFTPSRKFDRLHGSTWSLDGMELEIHPLLYSGVRDTDSGELGSNWYPQTAALPTVDHVRYPHTYPLGLILPIRWGWDWKKGRDHTRLGGGELLRLAGIPYSSRRAADAWTKLKKNLAELERVGGIGRIEWEGEPWSLSGFAMLYPPQWARERTVHQIRPIEIKALAFAVPMTGTELAEWRKSLDLTQAAAAERLGVSERTIRNAEKGMGRKLGPSLTRAFASRPASAATPKAATVTPQER